MYTSGSTGAPKGVMVSHRVLANTLLWMRDASNFAVEDVVAHKTPTSFTDSVWELILPLITGARVEILPEAVTRDPYLLHGEFKQHGVTVAQFVLPAMAAFLDAVEQGQVGHCRA